MTTLKVQPICEMPSFYKVMYNIFKLRGMKIELVTQL